MIKLIVLDVDGTLTDGKLYIDNLGNEMKAFNVKDGLAISQLIKYGIDVAIITGKVSNIVEKRCKDLGIKEIRQGIKDKVFELESILKKYSLTYDNVAFMGDDLLDLKVMKLCGLCGAPKDSAREVLAISNFVSTKNGGEGAVREFIEQILKEKGIWGKIVENFETTAQ